MSEIRTATISNLAGTGPATLTGQYAAKAWVNFNGTGTVAIRESGNVTSITDNGTGAYTVNFTTAMPDTNYAVATTARIPGNFGSSLPLPDTSNTTSAFAIVTRPVSDGDAADAQFVYFQAFR